MIKRLAALLMLALVGSLFASLFLDYSAEIGLNATARYYAEHTATDLGAANVVTAIVVTYRGLDTLGEVTVLFLAASLVGLVLARGREKADGRARSAPPPGELLVTGSALLVPMVLLLGGYVFVNGHLTPGGGFQGGAILASATLLVLLAYPGRRLGHRLIATVEALAGVFYVVIGLLGMVLAGGFLDNRVLPIGQLGELASAGAIPLIYSLIGLKVGAEFSTILAHLSEDA